jgi:Tfp pilus assembly protein PilE
MEIARDVVIIALLAFILFFVYLRAYNKGYKKGATAVLNQWKQTLKESGEE